MKTKLKNFLKNAGSLISFAPTKIQDFDIKHINSSDVSITKYFQTIEKRMKKVAINEAHSYK